MPRTRRHDSKTDSKRSPEWSSLTWDDLDAWAGSRSLSRGRTYQSQGRVRELVASRDGRLLATVIGGDHYVVSVRLSDSEGSLFESRCTCPVGHNGCKHAVAVVAEYLERLAERDFVPTAEKDDPRWGRLEDVDSDEDRDEDDFSDESEEFESQPRRKRVSAGRGNWDERIRGYIFAKGREELAELVWSLTGRFPELREEFRERIALGEGDADRLVAQARKELQRISSQEAWRSGWTGEGNTPDYSKLLHRLERLVELGHADAVSNLGRDLIERGIEQVGRSNDEGETAMELARCLPIVFEAVVKSSWSPVRKLLFAIDANLRDEYDVIGSASDVVVNEKYQPSDWAAVADGLSRRLSSDGKRHHNAVDAEDEEEQADEYSRNYHRDRVTDWLVKALDHAGRGREVSAVLEREARLTGSYERLVNHLIECRRFDDARQWAAEGIAKTANRYPGIASNLAATLRDLARSQKRWDIVAAHAACEFFDSPTRERFEQLLSAADRAGCGESVRGFGRRFLETGISPVRVESTKLNEDAIKQASDWPLPVPEYLTPMMRSERSARRKPEPHFDVLIDIAIAARRPDDILDWYDRMCAAQNPSSSANGWNGSGAHADRVAEAVARSHPQRALGIYGMRIEQNLQHTGTNAYETVASYLRKMRPVLKSIRRERDWEQLIEDIRIRYRNRPKLMEILERLEGKPILATRKRRR